MGVDEVSRRSVVFLDRDGVINRAIVRSGIPHPPATVADLELLPGVPDALARLRAAGFLLVVVTNQPDVSRGRQTREAVERIHEELKSRLPLDEFRVCYHDDTDACRCRKPAPGMLQATAKARGLELSTAFMVGDRWRDIEAGQRAGCSCYFVDHGYAERQPNQPFVRVASLAEAADRILETLQRTAT